MGHSGSAVREYTLNTTGRYMPEPIYAILSYLLLLLYFISIQTQESVFIEQRLMNVGKGICGMYSEVLNSFTVGVGNDNQRLFNVYYCSDSDCVLDVNPGPFQTHHKKTGGLWWYHGSSVG